MKALIYAAISEQQVCPGNAVNLHFKGLDTGPNQVWKSAMAYGVQSLKKGSLLSHSSLQSNFVSDAIIGSLPQGLSGKEREKVFQSVPLSPTLNLLNSMPQVSQLL